MAKRRRRKQEKKTTTIVDYLPDDILLMILDRLDKRDHSSLSLVSKSFRSLTDSFVYKLNFNGFMPMSKSAFSRLFARFSSVWIIEIRFEGRITRALKAISNSRLKIECLTIRGRPRYPKRNHMIKLSGRLGMVKALKLEWFSDATDWQVVEFIHLFSSLQELDLSGCGVWTDNATELLALNAPNLIRRINPSFNKDLTDRSLDALSTFPNLEEISLQYCDKITAQGVCAFLQKKQKLKFLRLPTDVISAMQDDADALAKTISFCENLSHLSFSGRFVTDASLRVIAKSRSPLMSLEIEPLLDLDMTTYTMTGLSVMLNAFQGLTKLDICLPLSRLDTQDRDMSLLVKSLTHLETIHLTSYTAIYATLFSLIHNCPLLKLIYINSCDSNPYCDVPQLVMKNSSIRHIFLHPLPDALLKMAIKSSCPEAKLNSLIVEEALD